MKVKVKFWDGMKNAEIKENAKVIDVLRELNVNPETVIVKKRNEIVLEDEKLSDNEEIELIKVVSGG
ncbi:MAG: MoaD/ThiS family protein [Candidatus Aenigmarchaeota archaeon]|nr:MoaD/ThiS family protein [Candidatus Aenigmarchaeota archaeon]